MLALAILFTLLAAMGAVLVAISITPDGAYLGMGEFAVCAVLAILCWVGWWMDWSIFRLIGYFFAMGFAA